MKYLLALLMGACTGWLLTVFIWTLTLVTKGQALGIIALFVVTSGLYVWRGGFE